MIKKIITILVLSLAFTCCTSQVHADVGFSITPPVTEVILAPNKTLNLSFTLTNLGSDSTSYELSLHQLIPQGNNGGSTINPSPLNLTDIPVIITSPQLEVDTPLTLPAHATTTVTLNLTAASTDLATDVYFALLATPKSSMLGSSSTAGITALVLATIAPSAFLPASIDLDFHPPTFLDTSNSLALQPIVKNNTPIMAHIIATYTLSDQSGKVLFSSKTNPTLVLGDSSRNLSPLNYSPSITSFGPHTLKISILSEGGGAKLLETTSNVFFFPLRYTIIALILIALITIFVIRYNSLTKPPKEL